jgi:hypothetical protein
MGWRAYGEPVPEPSILVEFLLGGLWGAISIYSVAWVFVWWGWMTTHTMLVAGLAVGLIAGFYFGWGCARCKKEITKEEYQNEEDLLR